MQPDIKALADELIAAQGLPADYSHAVTEVIMPLAGRLVERQRVLGQPLVVGIHGAQGTGKSTLVLFLARMLTEVFGCPCASLSLDDLYLTRSERETLARQEHPLLLTRGVPGTHDITLGHQVLDLLLAARPGSEIRLPAFDKAVDDRQPFSRWPLHEGEAKIILLEGWCLAARPEPEVALLTPVNELEGQEDADGRWRRYVNAQLAGRYSDFYARIDYLIMLQAPSMAHVLAWRTLQEHKLAESRASALKECNSSLRLMSDAAIQRFVMHYERITRHALAEMPARADLLLVVDERHRITRQHYRTPSL
ncbi:MAG: hypothetical protein LAT63_08460 [Marinobacter sp.]|nr:hypothetical protein [Marinobacter sp.]